VKNIFHLLCFDKLNDDQINHDYIAF